MIQKKTILMICSWLNPTTGAGSFFWEQAGFMSLNFNMKLCVFKTTTYGARNFYRFFTHQICYVDRAPNGLPILHFNYPQLAYVGVNVNLKLFRSSIRKFQKYLLKENISVDLVHAQSLCNAGIMAQYFYEETGIPYVFTEHNQFNFRSISSINKKMIDRIFLNDFDKMVVSHDKIRQLSSNHLFADYVVVGNAIDDEIFNYCDRSEGNIFRILTIGRYTLIKDHETMLRALQVVDQKYYTFYNKKIEFIWLGYGDTGNETSIEIEKLLERYPLKNIDVTIIPKVERLYIKNYLQDSDLFLLTSIAEGMPVSVMEALACGIPVCTTSCGGVDELINDSNGRIFQIKNSTDIGNFIIDFYMGKYKFDRKNISIEFIRNWGKYEFNRKMSAIYNKMIIRYNR